MNRFRYPHGRGLYRSRNGIILGVCRGLASFFDLKAFWIRVIVVIFFLASGVWPVLVLYFIASLLMKPEPVRPIESEAEQEFYDSYTSSRPRATSRLKRRFHNLDHRIQRMEDMVTAREFEWDRKFNG
ncbi:MAG: envelope stress response membrane protein PspC [Deltaproteobacteria bacterium]|nr:envelope stress response membrane protein PspC [Deltaproteobacteria bacterium]